MTFKMRVQHVLAIVIALTIFLLGSSVVLGLLMQLWEVL